MTVVEEAAAEVSDPLVTVVARIPDGGLKSSTIHIDWITSPRLPEQLAAKGGFVPYLLVVVSTSDRREAGRYVFPIEWATARIVARKSGLITLHYTVVWLPRGANPKGKLLKKESGRYSRTLLEPNTDSEEFVELDTAIAFRETRMSLVKYNGRAWKNHRRIFGDLIGRRNRRTEEAPRKIYASLGEVKRIAEEFTLEIDVPKSAFGDPQSQLLVIRGLARIYPWWWHARPVDKCNVRGRALFTFFTLPMALAVALAAAIVVAGVMTVSALCALIAAAYLTVFMARGINYKPIYMPWEGPWEVWKHSNWPWWLTRKVATDGLPKKIEYKPRATWMLVLYPPIWLILALGLYRLYASNDPFGLVFTVLFVAYQLFVLIGLPMSRGAEARREPETLDHEELRRRADAERARQLEADLAPVSTGQSRRLVWLNLWRDIKSGVCKRFEEV